MPAIAYGTALHQIERVCTLGRERTCDIQVRDAAASRQHARVEIDAEGAWLVDLGSANGTRVNGERVRGRGPLKHGDRIAIGKAELVFSGTGRRVDRIGERIGAYRIEALIGQGLVGAVYRARQLTLDRDVAFKVLDPRFGKDDPAFAEQFLTAVNRAAAISHDGLVKLHECGQHTAEDGETMLWYSMELAQGDTLERLLERDGRMDPATALLVVERAARALAVAHAGGFAHGDIRVQTIMLTAHGRVQILDLGLVGWSGREGAEAMTRLNATQALTLAPERARGGAATPAGDVYALGCVLAQLLTGAPPFAGDDVDAVIAAHEGTAIPSLRGRHPTLPAALDETVSAMLAKRADWRFASMEEVADALKSVRSVLTPAAGMPAPSVVAVNRAAAEISGRRRALAAGRPLRLAAVVAVLVLIIAGALAWSSSWRSASQAAAAAPITAQSASPYAADVAPVVFVQVPPAAATAAAVSDPLTARWAALQTRLSALTAADDWGAAEREMETFANSLTAGTPWRATADSRAQQLRLDAVAWYRTQLAALPGDEAAPQLAARLQALERLRDVSGRVERGDAEARYQETLTLLSQAVAGIRNQARSAVQTGRFERLPVLAATLIQSVRATPVAGMAAPLLAQLQAVGELADAAHGAGLAGASTWPAMRAQLLSATGERALAAGAALLLADEADAARTVLADPILATGRNVARREALFGRSAAVLAFSDAADLQAIDITAGEPHMSDGLLSGGPEATTLSIAVPLRGGDWEIAAVLGYQAATGHDDGVLTLGLLSGDDLPVAVQFASDHVTVRVHGQHGWEETRDSHAPSARARLRLHAVAGTVTVEYAGRVVATVAGVQLPAGSLVQVSATEVRWTLDEVFVVGQ